jgi:hypothetical protein
MVFRVLATQAVSATLWSDLIWSGLVRVRLRVRLRLRVRVRVFQARRSL